MVGTKEFVKNAMAKAIYEEVEKNKKLTEYFLDKYFTKSNRVNFYYKGYNGLQYNTRIKIKV